MELSIKNVDGVHVASIIGNLDTNTAQEAEDGLKSIVEGSGAKLIINLSETNYVSSAGLRVFLASAKKISAGGGKFIISSPNNVVKEVLDISGFSTILDIKDSESEALAEM